MSQSTVPAESPETAAAGTLPTVKQNLVMRSCILCGEAAATPLFTYTLDFLVNVRGQSETSLRGYGWTEDTRSTIVRCDACGCDYVRECILVPEEVEVGSGSQSPSDGDDEIAKYVRKQAAAETSVDYEARDRENWIIRNLVLQAAAGRKEPIRFLDYGAGSCSASASARACGVRDVIAYDPFWPLDIQRRIDATKQMGIVCVRTKEELSPLGPFNAAIFQSAIEHVVDPRGELQTLFELLVPGGLLYVNNPVMDLRRELDALRAAKTIKKGERISHYHPFHLNYMRPNEFASLLTDVGFEITPTAYYPPLPWVPGQYGKAALQAVKLLARQLQNRLGLPYDRYVYVVRKPA